MHDNKDLSSVQKRQVITSQSVDTAHSEKTIGARVEDKKDQMENNIGQIDVNNDSSSVQKRQPGEEIQIEESTNKGNTVNDQSKIPVPISAKKHPINLKVKATRKHGFRREKKVTENIGNNEKENNVVALEIIKCIRTLIKCIQTLINGSPGFLWGILFLLAFQAALTHASPTNGTSNQASLTTLLSS